MPRVYFAETVAGPALSLWTCDFLDFVLAGIGFGATFGALWLLVGPMLRPRAARPASAVEGADPGTLRPVKFPCFVWKLGSPTFSADGIDGSVVAMSVTRLVVKVDGSLAVGDSLRLLLEPKGRATGHLYGTVTGRDEELWVVDLTTIAPEDQEALRRVLE